ncbi:MAG: response regulator transcription factor [Syntrophaceae bacterium]|nr:response regulator transcription factor [Syntrophaceae bacterium]
MRILIAEDDAVSRLVLETLLKKWEYDVVSTLDGKQAWERLQLEDSPRLAILDWMMPEMEGVEICRRARENDNTKSKYIILLTAKGSKDDIIAGLEAGADDYLTKPVNSKELLARLKVGIRILNLQESLAARVRELESANTHIKSLQGLLPICSYCKKIRNDNDYWEQMEGYITKHSDAVFSHSICPECYEKYSKQIKAARRK